MTLWYRAPELLLGSELYSTAIDIWAIGCIFGELLLHRPMMPGKNELDQVSYIFDVLGCPTAKIWPELTLLPMVARGMIDLRREQEKNPYNNLRMLFPTLSDEGFELMNLLLALDPSKRITAVGFAVGCAHHYIMD